MLDMFNMLGKVKELQSKLKETRDRLGKEIITAESGAGMVKATVNGNRQIVKIEIDQEIIKKEDKELIQDLTVAAVNKAMQEMDEKIKEEMKKSTNGLLPNIPGLDLSNLMQ
jgi:DNA-binding YbaB/EbfC family protein